MSRGVFGTTIWPVQYVLCLYSCLEYLGQACCSTCLSAAAPASLLSDAVRQQHSCQPFLAPFRLKLDLPCLTDLLPAGTAHLTLQPLPQGPSGCWTRRASAPSGFGSFGVKQCPLGEDMVFCQPGEIVGALGLQFLFLPHDSIEL